MARSLNKIQLIGNLTADAELRYTEKGAAVTKFSLATNRYWTVGEEKREEVEYHHIVAWDKLAELCAKLLTKGRRVYVEGRISYRKYTAKDNTEKTLTEIVISDMLLLDSQKEKPQTEEIPTSEEIADGIPF